jgi:hypothetical protein
MAEMAAIPPAAPATPARIRHSLRSKRAIPRRSDSDSQEAHDAHGAQAGTRVPAYVPGQIRVIPAPELLDFEPPRWVIKPFIESGIRGILYGASDIGKTFLCLDLALSIATGRQWCGLRTVRAPVVYICAEGSRSLGRRVRGWLTYHGVPDAAITATFHAIGTPVQIVNAAERAELLTALRAAAPAIPALIVVDTLSWCILGMDENDSGAMTRLIGATALLQRDIADAYAGTDPATLFVHHTGKTKKAIRGAYGLEAASDLLLKLDRKKDSLISLLHSERVKDGPRSYPLAFLNKQVDLGHDDSGDAITTCVAVWAGREVDDPLSVPQQKVVELLTSYSPAYRTWSEVKREAGLTDMALYRALKMLVERNLITHTARKGYKLSLTPLTPAENRHAKDVSSENPSATLSHSLTHPPFLEGGRVSKGVSEGPKKNRKGFGLRSAQQGKPIRLGEPVRFASLSPDDADEDAGREE